MAKEGFALQPQRLSSDVTHAKEHTCELQHLVFWSQLQPSRRESRSGSLQTQRFIVTAACTAGKIARLTSRR